MSRSARPIRAPSSGPRFELAMACCDEADALALASFRQGVEVEAKPDASFVTAADRAVERMIRTRIAARFPGHGLVGEEYGEEQGQAAQAGGRRWIIDPIDGTHSYMRGVPIFATLLAYEVEGRLGVGVVSAPALHRRWFAWRDGGAWSADTSRAGADLTSATPTPRLRRRGPRARPARPLVVDSRSAIRISPLASSSWPSASGGNAPTGTSGAMSSWPRALPSSCSRAT